MLPLLFGLGLPVQAEVDKTLSTKVTAELEKLKDSQFVDFGKTINKSVESTKKKESEFAKKYCQKFKDNKSQINCVKFLSPYGESLRKVKEPLWLWYCLPFQLQKELDIENGKLPIPNKENILNLSKCLRSNAKVKTPASVFETIDITFNDAINAPIYDTFIHKGKTYTASRACGEGRSMQWMTYPSFLGIGGRVEELGCMNRREHEEYMRNYRAGIDSRPVIINNPAPASQPTRSAPLQFDYNPPNRNYSSPLAPKQPSQIRLYNNNSSGGVQNCSRFGNTDSFNCY